MHLHAPVFGHKTLPCGHMMSEQCVTEMRRGGASGRCLLCLETLSDPVGGLSAFGQRICKPMRQLGSGTFPSFAMLNDTLASTSLQHARCMAGISRKATENPTNVYRDEILYRTLITFDVQGTTHNNLYRFRHWLVQCLGGNQRHRINFQVSVDYIFEADGID